MWGVPTSFCTARGPGLAWTALCLTEFIQVGSLVLVGRGQRGEIFKQITFSWYECVVCMHVYLGVVCIRVYGYMCVYMYTQAQG